MHSNQSVESLLYIAQSCQIEKTRTALLSEYLNDFVIFVYVHFTQQLHSYWHAFELVAFFFIIITNQYISCIMASDVFLVILHDSCISEYCLSILIITSNYRKIRYSKVS